MELTFVAAVWALPQKASLLLLLTYQPRLRLRLRLQASLPHHRKVILVRRQTITLITAEAAEAEEAEEAGVGAKQVVAVKRLTSRALSTSTTLVQSVQFLQASASAAAAVLVLVLVLVLVAAVWCLVHH